MRTEPYAHTLSNISQMKFEFLDEFEELSGSTVDVRAFHCLYIYHTHEIM